MATRSKTWRCTIEQWTEEQRETIRGKLDDDTYAKHAAMRVVAGNLEVFLALANRDEANPEGPGAQGQSERRS